VINQHRYIIDVHVYDVINRYGQAKLIVCFKGTVHSGLFFISIYAFIIFSILNLY
jgi:ribose 5-phosphate isomerase